jgi:O-antigen ligase
MVDMTGPNDNTVPAAPSAGIPARSRVDPQADHRVGRHGDRLARWAAIALGASLPISTALDNILLALIVIGWIISAGFRAKWSAIRASWTSLALIAICVLAAIGVSYTVAPLDVALRSLLKHLFLLAIPILLSLAWTQRERDLAIRAFAVAMLVVLALSYGLAAGIVPSGPGPLIKGIATNPFVFKLQITQNYLMAFAVFIFAGYAINAARRAARAGWALASLAAVINVGVMVQGRTGYVVLLVLALVVLGHWYGWRGLAVAVLGGAVLVAGAYTSSSTFRLRVDQVGTEWAKWREGKPRESGGVFDRLIFFANTVPIIEAHPVLGVGTGGFAEAYRTEVAGTKQIVTQNPHNQYLLTAAEQGAVGLALLICLFCSVWRDSRRRLIARDRLILQSLLAATVVASLANSMLIDHVETLFFAWGCGIALAGPRREAIQGRSAEVRHSRASGNPV